MSLAKRCSFSLFFENYHLPPFCLPIYLFFLLYKPVSDRRVLLYDEIFFKNVPLWYKTTSIDCECFLVFVLFFFLPFL